MIESKLVQVSMEEALKRQLSGENIKMVCPNKLSDRWNDCFLTTLNDMLAGAIFFAETWPEGSSTEENPSTKEEDLPTRQRAPKKREIDEGKIVALYKAGRTPEWIAADMRVPIEKIKERIAFLMERNVLAKSG